MYSVEDLLISHGYKLPRHGTSSSRTTPAPTPSSQQGSSPPPPLSYNQHHEILENRPGSRAVNGFEKGSEELYGSGGGTRPSQQYGCGCVNNNNETRDVSQTRRDGDGRVHGDTQSLGESLMSDSGFSDSTRVQKLQPKDVSYWRRKGQDFTVLLDYSNASESQHGVAQGGHSRPEGPQQARGQVMSSAECQRACKERQQWAAQAQTQARSREREAALHQWKMANERKCKSLGTDEWRPAVHFGRQMSQSECERWTQEYQRLQARTPEGMVVHPTTKAKSQSLPRMLQPERLQYVDVSSSGPELYRRVNGHPFSHHDFSRAIRWPENDRPASATPLSMTSKPRFNRPPRPPSYEMHQQIRGSYELLSGRDSATIPQAMDRNPLLIPRTGDPQLTYFAQDSGPPGYIPPPSYKRAPIMAGGCQGYGEIAVDYRYRGDVYQQMHVAADGSHWFSRHPAGSWSDPHRKESLSCQKQQLYPVYTSRERTGAGIQYISFSDPRIRHISTALGDNSLTDADKIRHIRNELPSATVSEPAADDSAFLPPTLGTFMATKLTSDANQTSSSDFVNDNNRWHRDLHKETIDNFPAPDQNCNNRYPRNQQPPPSPSPLFQAPKERHCSQQESNSDRVFAETITQVKKISPDSGPHKRNTKRRVSETIFCLVSVPVHTAISISKDLSDDQNNNETAPNLTVHNRDTFAVGLREGRNIRSKSVNEMPIRPHYSVFHTSNTSSMRNYKRAPLRKEIIDAWALQARQDKELCCAGSWPGNQYRNQETQTGSPLTVVKSPEHKRPPGEQELVQSVLDTSPDMGVGTDNISSYGYPMTGQKDLHLSSNSAFSCLNLSPTQPTLTTKLQQPLQLDLSSPSKIHKPAEQQPSTPRKSNSCPPESTDQVAFGQFLLKPVNRRPCDAIGALESFNKAMEDTISKRPNVGQDIRFKKAHSIVGQEPGRETISVEKPTSIKVRSKSLNSTNELDSMDVIGAFSRPQANSMPPTNELAMLPVASLRDNSLLSSLNEPNHLYRQDITVPEESLLRDVGLTVYTETPGEAGEPMQRSLSVPLPLIHKESDESLQLEWKKRVELERNGGSPEHISVQDHHSEVDLERGTNSDYVPPFRDDVCSNRTGGESGRSSIREDSLHVTWSSREATFMFEEEDDNEQYGLSEALANTNDSTIADKHLEDLLSQEKANALPAEDLSNLYEIKCADGIPENESIEQRAARILGIAVPVEALGVAEDDQEETVNTVAMKTPTPSEETKQVIGEYEQVKEDHWAEAEEVKETGFSDDHKEDEGQKYNSNNTNQQQDHEGQSGVSLDLPEFPPSKLPLTLPVSTDGRTVRRISSGESEEVSLQDKLNSSASLFAVSMGRSTTDIAHLKELESVSRTRHLESGAELGCEETKVDGEEEDGEVQAGATEEIEENLKIELENSDTNGNAHESEDKLGDAKEDCNPEEVEEMQRLEDEAGERNVELALKANVGMIEEIGVEIETGEPVEEVGLKTVEDDDEKHVEKTRNRQNTGECSTDESSQHKTEKERTPKPKQRTRLQKPPLLPKPRSVPKREISLPPGFISGICEPANVEDDEMLSVSESYDPSRVERV